MSVKSGNTAEPRMRQRCMNIPDQVVVKKLYEQGLLHVEARWRLRDVHWQVDLALMFQASSEFLELHLKHCNVVDQMFGRLAPCRCFEEHFASYRGEMIDLDARLSKSDID